MPLVACRRQRQSGAAGGYRRRLPTLESAPRPALPAAPRGGMSKVARPHLLTISGPSLSRPHLALRCGRGSHEGHEKPGQDRSQIDPTVEADLMLGEVAMAVLGEGEDLMAVDAAATKPSAGRSGRERSDRMDWRVTGRIERSAVGLPQDVHATAGAAGGTGRGRLGNARGHARHPPCRAAQASACGATPVIAVLRLPGSMLTARWLGPLRRHDSVTATALAPSSMSTSVRPLPSARSWVVA